MTGVRKTITIPTKTDAEIVTIAKLKGETQATIIRGALAEYTKKTMKKLSTSCG